MEACGRDQTPFGLAPQYACTRPRGHSGPCAMVYIHPEADLPEVQRGWPRWLSFERLSTVLCLLLIVAAVVFALALGLILDAAMRGHP
jgi:hypothetical protein